MTEVPHDHGERWLRAAAVANDTAERLDAYEQLAQARPGDAQAAYLLGQELARSGARERARRQFERALALDPNEARALVGLGILHQRAGRLAEAEQAYQEAASRRPDLVAARLNLGRIHARQGRWQEAAREFHSAVKAAPTNADARCGLGRALTALGRLDDAAHQWQRALQADPCHGGAMHELGRACLKRGEFDAAQEYFASTLSVERQHTGAALGLAEIALRRNDRDGAEAALARLPAPGKLATREVRRLVRLLWDHGLVAEALSRAEAAVEARPDSASTRLVAASYLCRAGEYGRATRHLRAAVEAAPGRPRALRMLAAAYSVQGMHDQATPLYARALQAEPDEVWPYLGLVRVAVRALRPLEVTHQPPGPELPHAHACLGLMALALGSRNEAAVHFRDAQAANAQFAPAQAGLGVVDALDHQPTAALGKLQTALALQGDDPALAYLAGCTAAAAQRHDLATQALGQALRTPLEDAVLRAQAFGALARSQRHLGRPVDAVQACTEALRLDPGNPRWLLQRAVALQEHGDYAGAGADYAACLEAAPANAAAHFGLGATRQAAGEMAEALACYEQALRWRRGDAQAHYYAGVVAGALGLKEHAAEHLLAYLKLGPQGSHVASARARLSRLQAPAAAQEPFAPDVPIPAPLAPDDVFVHTSELDFGGGAFAPGSPMDPRR